MASDPYDNRVYTAKLIQRFVGLSTILQHDVLDMTKIVTDTSASDQDRWLAWHTIEDALFPEEDAADLADAEETKP